MSCQPHRVTSGQRPDWTNDNFYIARENLHTKPCVSTAPDTHSAYMTKCQKVSLQWVTGLCWESKMLKFLFCHACGLNVCENECGYSWNNCSRNFEAVWEICLIKCDFTAEIQPQKNGQWHRARLCRHHLVKENKEQLYFSHLLC